MSRMCIKVLDAQRRLMGNLEDGLLATEQATVMLSSKDQLPQLGTDAVSGHLVGLMAYHCPSLPPSLPRRPLWDGNRPR